MTTCRADDAIPPTFVCTTCGNAFEAVDDEVLDSREQPTCVACYCSWCSIGHLPWAGCRIDETDFDPTDPDAVRDAYTDHLAGV